MGEKHQLRLVRGRPDEALFARVVRRVHIRYRGGADSDLDRPAHVRAASGLAWAGDRLVVVQDDANFFALVDPQTGLADAVPLPAGPAGARQFDDARGNKRDKLDLEALTTVPRRGGAILLAFGSGSTARRECIAVVARIGHPDVTVAVHPVRSLYAQLRASTHFAGSDLNIEGALHVAGRIRLFGRGNGASRDGLQPIDAMCDLDSEQLLAHLERPDAVPPPSPDNVVQFDLGTLGGVRLSFTDVTADESDGRRTIFAAAAESSPDATRDGDVAGSAIGMIEESSTGIGARWTELVDADGRLVPDKIEGIALHRTMPGRVFVVADRDTHHLPSELCEVALSGAWPSVGSVDRSSRR